MIKVEVCADTYEELKEQVAKLAITLGIGSFDVQTPEPKKAAKAPKKEKPEVMPLPNHAGPESTPAPATTAAPTFDAASAMLKKLNDSKGLPAAREVLSAVGANRMSEVDPGQYAAVIRACEMLLA